MLVITLKAGESVQIGPSITVRVIQGPRGHLRLGIEAPRAFEIERKRDGDCRD